MSDPRPLDREILAFLSRFGYARAWHVMAWTGCGAWTAEERLREMRKAQLVAVVDAPAALWDPTLGRVRETLIPAWYATPRAARWVGPTPVPGTDQVVQPRRTPSSVSSAFTIIPTVDLAVWYRVYGFAVVAPREVQSLEGVSGLHRGAHAADPRWTLRPITWGGSRATRRAHVPTLGAIHPGGQRWVVELEHTPQPLGAYRDLMLEAGVAGVGVVWHTRHAGARRRILRAGEELGYEWRPHPDERGVMAARGGMVRVQPWTPGPLGLNRPPEWRGHVPARPPGGIPVPRPLPDLRAAWKPAVARAEAARTAA